MDINKKKISIAILKWIGKNWFRILIIISLIYLIAWLRDPFSQINIDATIHNDATVTGRTRPLRINIEP